MQNKIFTIALMLFLSTPAVIKNTNAKETWCPSETINNTFTTSYDKNYSSIGNFSSSVVGANYSERCIFDVGATSIPSLAPLCESGPRRAGGLGGEDGDGTTGDGSHLNNPAPIGDIPWGMILLLAGVLVLYRQRQSKHNPQSDKQRPTSTNRNIQSKTTIDMNKMRSILLLFVFSFCSLSMSADVYFDRMWAKRAPSYIRGATAVPATKINPGANAKGATTGSFFVRNDNLYIYITKANGDGTYTGRLYRYSSTGAFQDSTDVWQNADPAYNWCEYYAPNDRLYWFTCGQSGNGYVSTTKTKPFTAAANVAPATIAYRKHTDGNTYKPYSNTSQVAVNGSLVWSVKAWDSSGNNQKPVIYRTAFYNETSYGVGTWSRTKVTENVSSGGTGVPTVVIPVDNNNALIVRQGRDLLSYTYKSNSYVSNKDTKTVSIGAEGYATLGGAAFKHNGAYYYVTGCTASNSKQHVGACVVYQLSGATISSGTPTTPFTTATEVARYSAPIANTNKDNSATNASKDVTFRVVDKGDNVLIYAFAPKNGVACYYFSTNHHFDYTVEYNSGSKAAVTTDGQTKYQQTMRSGVAANLNACAFECKPVITYLYQDYLNTEETRTTSCTFTGWDDRTTIVYWKDKDRLAVQNWRDTLFDAPFYAQTYNDVFTIAAGSVYNKTALLNHYLDYGQGEGRTPTAKSSRALYPDQAPVCNLSVNQNVTAKLYAHWTDGNTTLITPTRLAYAFKGWYSKATGGSLIGQAGAQVSVTTNKTYYARWELLTTDEGETDLKDRIITWTPSSVTFDLNGYCYGANIYPANGGTRQWYINDIPVAETANTTPYPTTHSDKTFTIAKPASIHFTAGEYVRITLFHTTEGGSRTLVAAHTFRIPVIDALPDDANTDNDLYIHSPLTVSGSIKAQNVYIEPTATLTIPSGAMLTVSDALYIRSRYTDVGALINEGTLSLGEGKCVYTRQMAQRNIGEPLAMPFSCLLPTNGNGAYIELKTRLQAQTGNTAGNHVDIYKYNGQIRAEQGGKAVVWEPLKGTGITLNATDGYEIISGSNYYREYLFPTTYTRPAEATRDLLAYSAENTAFNNIGWNFFCTPYTGTYSGSLTLSPNTTQAYPFITMYNADGSFNQTTGMETAIPPFTPYYVQVNEDATLTYESGVPLSLRAVSGLHRETAATSWAGLVLSDGELSDKTALVINNRYTCDYEIGADLEKCFAATSVARPQVYIPTFNGKRAFNAVSEYDAAEGVPVAYIASRTGELTFSLNSNLPLNRVCHVYLTDSELGITTDLTQQDYTFTTDACTNETRFSLSVAYQSGITTDNNPLSDPYNCSRKLLRNGALYITSGSHIYTITGVRVN